jgi:hypothetical protein
VCNVADWHIADTTILPMTALRQKRPFHNRREFEAGRLATNTGFRQKSPVLSRHNDTGGWRSGSPAARHEQEMAGTIHELLA